MERSKEIIEFIKENETLFWYSDKTKLENISDDFLVETILNYGDRFSVRKLFDLLGFYKTAEIYFKNSSKKRHNYLPMVKNYFDLHFNYHIKNKTYEK